MIKQIVALRQVEDNNDETERVEKKVEPYCQAEGENIEEHYVYICTFPEVKLPTVVDEGLDGTKRSSVYGGLGGIMPTSIASFKRSSMSLKQPFD